MEIKTFVQNLNTRLKTFLDVKTVYGDPIDKEGKTIIPVARVYSAFGGGFGEDAEAEKSGGGGGGYTHVEPLGFIEVTAHETRFVETNDWRRVAATVLAGAALGLWLARRNKK